MYSEVNEEIQRRTNEIQLSHDIYDTLCIIEYDIINKKIELDLIDKVIKKAINLVNQLIQRPKCILIKIMQISKLLLQINHPKLDALIKEFQQVNQNYEDDLKSLNLIQNNENYEISKAYILDQREIFEYIALSPNEKYLLVGTSSQVYLYDILTKLNIKIYKESTLVGLFSSNSRKIILITFDRIEIIDISSSKKQSYRYNVYIESKGYLMNKNYFYFTCLNPNGLSRTIKINLKSNHQICSYILRDHQCFKVQIYQDLITLYYDDYLHILDDKTRKSELKIKISDYRMREPFLINKNEMLSIDYALQLLIIWNIDYQNNTLIQNKALPFSASQLFRGNPNFGYFYLINFGEFQIIDENYQSIYNYNKYVSNDPLEDSTQLNTDRIFIISQQDGIYILKRQNQR